VSGGVCAVALSFALADRLEARVRTPVRLQELLLVLVPLLRLAPYQLLQLALTFALPALAATGAAFSPVRRHRAPASRHRSPLRLV